MNEKIQERCCELNAAISEYSECNGCGGVVRDSSLLIPDELNRGKFRAVCPICKKEEMRTAFPPGELKNLFGMIVECVEKPIIVLVLCRTVFEVFIDVLLYRLMERRFTDGDLAYAVMSCTRYDAKVKIIQDITGKKLKDLARKAGYDDLTQTLNELTSKRNKFLHEGISTKSKFDEFGHFIIPKPVPLGAEDVLQAVNFAIDAVGFFAKTFSDNSKWCNPFEDDGIF
jgi:hypothetical protein